MQINIVIRQLQDKKGNMKKTRIAFFAEILVRDFDGATRTMFEIIDRIDRDRFEFIFFCGVPPTEDIGFEVFHIPTLTLPFNKTYKMASMVGMGPSIIEKLDNFGPDLIHVATPAPLGYFALKYGLRRNVSVTTIYHTHFISYIKYYTHNTPLITSAFEAAMVQHNRSFYNRCDKIFVPTLTMKEELEERGFDGNLMEIWQRGINTELFNPSKRDDEYMQRIVDNGKKNILFVSRLVWEKNLEVLINLQNIINDKNLNFNLIIAGDGVAKDELEKRIPDAFFLGHVGHEELAKLYASSDYFIFTSVTETYGNVVAEAMVSGLACIAADGGGPRSFIKEGINGYLCKPNNAKDYLNKIQLLEDHPEFKKRMTEQGIKDMKDLTWDLLVDILLNNMDKLIKEKKASISNPPKDSYKSDFVNFQILGNFQLAVSI